MEILKQIITLAIIIFLAGPLSVAAQGACAPTAIPVTMSLAGDLGSTVPSASVGFHARIDNPGKNIYPDAVIVVDIVRENEEGVSEIVDRFTAPQHVTIFAHYTGTVDFIWPVPPHLHTGTYTVVATLAPQGASAAEVFAHVGYPTASTDIGIQDGAETSASIRVLTVNGQPYKALTVAHISDGASSANATVHNGSTIPYIGTITWRRYAADATLGDKPVDEQTAPVELHPGTDTQVTYQLPQEKGGAYYVEGELSDGQQSVLFDILLDSNDAAFPWATCNSGVLGAIASMNGRTYGAIGLALILAGGAWYFIRRRTVAHREHKGN